MLLNVAFSELKMKKGKVVLTNRGSIALRFSNLKLLSLKQLPINTDFTALPAICPDM